MRSSVSCGGGLPAATAGKGTGLPCASRGDPKQTKTIVRREVTRVLTPGTGLDPALGAEQSNYLASVCVPGGGFAGLRAGAAGSVDGGFRATEFAGAGGWAALVDELGRVRPVELLYGTGCCWVGMNLCRGGFFGAGGWVGWDSDEDGGGGVGVYRGVCGAVGANHSRCTRWMGWGWVGMRRQRWRRGRLLHYMRATKQGGLEHVDGIVL